MFSRIVFAKQGLPSLISSGNEDAQQDDGDDDELRPLVFFRSLVDWTERLNTLAVLGAFVVELEFHDSRETHMDGLTGLSVDP